MRLKTEDWEKIDRVNILDYATSQGFSVVRNGRTWHLKEHDSCVFFSPNSFFRFSTHTSGGIYQFIKEFVESDHTKALQMALNLAGVESNLIQDSKQETKDKEYSFQLPEKDNDMKSVFHYLCNTRKIPYQIVQQYASKKILYQDKNKNCVFVGRYEDKAYFATKHSTGKKNFKGDVANSIKEIGIYIEQPNAKDLIVTEAVIDQMSFMAMYGKAEPHNYLSINGVGALEGCLNFWLTKRADQINEVYLALDNDSAGKEATKRGRDFIKGKFPNVVIKEMLPVHKDWNEDLVIETEKQLNQRRDDMSEEKKSYVTLVFSPKNTNEFNSKEKGTPMVGIKFPVKDGPWLNTAVAKVMVHHNDRTGMDYVSIPADEDVKINTSVPNPEGGFTTESKMMKAFEIAAVIESNRSNHHKESSVESQNEDKVYLNFGKKNSAGNGKEFTTKEKGTAMVSFKVPRQDEPWLDTAFPKSMVGITKKGGLFVHTAANSEIKLHYSEKIAEGQYEQKHITMTAKELSKLIDDNHNRNRQENSVEKTNKVEEAR